MTYNNFSFQSSAKSFVVGLLLSSFIALLFRYISDNNDPKSSASAAASALVGLKWATAQWLPLPMLAYQWQEEAWSYWKEQYISNTNTTTTATTTLQDIPIVHVQDFRHQNVSELLEYIEQTHGKDWRSRPLLLKGLWNIQELQSNEASRRLSRTGLLQEKLVVPYFTDARHYGALSPNAKAPVKEIVHNITQGQPLKIGTQLVVQTYPELVQEVAPIEIVTGLFGNHFSPQQIVGGAFGLPFLPALTTVPLFVAATTTTTSTTMDNDNDNDNDNPRTGVGKKAFTALHCEPIGNVAVQLEGEKQWTLISPDYSFWVQPTTSPDGRAFFASGMTSEEDLAKVPRYSATTQAGDAMWVPTWTWHRVDYTTTTTSSSASKEQEEEGNQLAIGASLFHLRPKEFFHNNPLFAFLVIPNLIKEVFRFKTQ